MERQSSSGIVWFTLFTLLAFAAIGGGALIFATAANRQRAVSPDSGQITVAVDKDRIYVLRGDSLFEFSKDDMRLVRSSNLRIAMNQANRLQLTD